jgi:hypothetical protein
MIGSANQANISATRLGDFLIPLPSLAEQIEIVKKVNLLTAIADNLKEQYDESVHNLFKLEKSIIQNAFNVKGIKIDDNSLERTTVIDLMRSSKKLLEEEKKRVQKSQAQTRNIMKKSASNNSALDVEDVLKAKNVPQPADIVWRASKYKGDIDAFYAALKEKNGHTIEWELVNDDKAVPQSMISLKSQL